MSTLYAKVLRDTDVEANFIGNKLEIRQFGFASDTKALVVRDERGGYHFIRQYNDETVRGIIDALAGNLAAHVQNLEIHISDEERQAWNGKQDALVAGENIQIGTDGRTISATDTVYDDTDLQNRIEEEAVARGEADAELQAQIDTLLGAIIFIGRINLPNSAVTQSALTARAQELGRYPLVKGYCLIDNDSDDWVWDGESEWIDVGYYQVAQATNTSLGVVKGSSENLKIGVDGSGEMAVNGLQEALANSDNGIQPRVRLDRAADWNTHTTSGFYLKQASANASDVANSPPYYTAGTGDWTLFVIGGTDGGATGNNAPAAPGGCIQLARYASNSTVILYYRSYGVAGSSNSAGWSAWTSLSFWGGFNSGTSTALQDPNQTLTAGQYSNNWTGVNTPTGTAIRGSLLVLASDVEQIAANRQQVFFEQGGTNRAWYRTTATGTWKEIGAAVGDVSWNDILNKPNIPVGANLTEQAAVFGQSARSGSADTWARSDHYHALPSAPTVPIGANIDASPLNSTVAHGSAQTWARSDHRHAIPAIPDAQVNSDWSSNSGVSQILNKPTIPIGANIDTAALNTTVTQGTSTNFARADHRHAIPTIPPAQIQSDWNSNSGVSQILNKPSIPAAHSGQSLNFRVGSSTNQLSFDTNDSTTKSFRLNAGSNVTLTVGGDSTNREVTIASTAGGGGSSVADLSGQGTPTFGQSAANGTASTAARSDHVHALPASPSIPTGANLSSQASAFGQSAQNGSATTWARSDHYHALPTAPTVPTGADLSSQASAFGQSARNGSAATWSRSDHYHALPAAPTLSSLGGEASISVGTTDQFLRGDKSWQAFNSILPVYGTSSTSASTTAKTSTITGFIRRTGSIVGISFTNANTASAPTLNVTSTGAADIKYNGSAPTSGMLAATVLHIFQFDGTNWQLLNPVVTSSGNSIPSPTSANQVLKSVSVAGSVYTYNWGPLEVGGSTTGILPIANGGTGNTTAAGALANLGGIGDRITTYATSSKDFDTITTSGVYSVYGSSSSSNHTPSTSVTGNNAWNLLVIASGNNGVIQIASPAATSGGTVYYRVGGGSSSTSFPTTWQTLSSGGGGSGISEPTNDSLTYGRRVTSGSGAWRRAVDLAGDTMTGILNIERSASSPSDANSYLRIRTNSGSIDGMRMGAATSGVNTCGGWIQGFYGNGTTGGININPLGGYTHIGGGMKTEGNFSVGTRAHIDTNGSVYVQGINGTAPENKSSRLAWDTINLNTKYDGTWDNPGNGSWRFYWEGNNPATAKLYLQVFNGSSSSGSWVTRVTFNGTGTAIT